MIPYVKSSEDEVRERIESAAVDDVRRSLVCARPGIAELLTLVSPAAGNMMDELREKAALNKRMHYGKTIRLYTPLYLSNYCINHCIYCGFNRSSREDRKRLSVKDAVREAEAVKSFGMDSILLVSGEDPEYISISYLEELVYELKKMFSYIAIEIYPLSEDDYCTLFNAGVDGLTLYQESYDRETYNRFHLAGPKADYDARLQAINNGAAAGFRNLGIGVLLGLYDWRLESFSLAAHAIWLNKRFWQSKIQFSFPRITAIDTDFKVPSPMNEDELEQMILAFRIVFPESEISVSTRETPEFRNRIALSAASLLSAASSVVPGGYSGNSDDLGQFSLHDTRTAETMDRELSSLGLDVVYKDWDTVFSV